MTVIGRDDAHPQIEFFFANRDLDATVLGSPSFGNVDSGEDLDPRQDGSQLPPGQRVAFVQHAVDAVPNSDAIFKWFHMDIRSPQLNSFGNHQLYQSHDRGTGLVDDFFGTGDLIVDGFGKVDRRIGKFLQDRVGRFPLDLTVQPVDRFEDISTRGQGGGNIAIQDEAEFVERVDIARVTDRDFQTVIDLRQWKHGVFTCHGFRHQLDDGFGNLDQIEIDIFHVMVRGHRLHHFTIGRIAKFDERLGQSRFGLPGQVVRIDDLVVSNNPILDEDFDEPIKL